MVRNKPKNSVVPSMKHDMAKKMYSHKSFMKSPPLTPRQKKAPLPVFGKHGPTAKNLTMRKGKSFKSGALGQQGASRGSPRSQAAGWENSQE